MRKEGKATRACTAEKVEGWKAGRRKETGNVRQPGSKKEGRQTKGECWQ
jgi:hypothetical protein